MGLWEQSGPSWTCLAPSFLPSRQGDAVVLMSLMIHALEGKQQLPCLGKPAEKRSDEPEDAPREKSLSSVFVLCILPAWLLLGPHQCLHLPLGVSVLLMLHRAVPHLLQLKRPTSTCVQENVCLQLF